MAGNAINLKKAIVYGNFAKLRQILEKGNVPVNIEYSYGQTPLYLATQAGNRKMVYYLLKMGAKPNIKTSNYGNTPLHKAANLGYTNIVRMLIRAGANVNKENNKGRTALNKAINPNAFVMHSRNKVIHSLIQAGAKVKKSSMNIAAFNNNTKQALINSMGGRARAKIAWRTAVRRRRVSRASL